MGSHLSLHHTGDAAKLRSRFQATSVGSVLDDAGKRGAGPQTLKSDATVEQALAALERGAGAAVVLDEQGRFVGALDQHCVLDFLVSLYRGALLEQRDEIVHHVYDPLFWGSFDEWVEKRRMLVVSPDAPQVVAEGAQTFFTMTVGDLMKTPVWNLHSRVAPVALKADTTLHRALPVLSQYHSALVDIGDGAYKLLTQMDVLKFLEKDLSGCCALHDVRARDLDALAKQQHLETTHVGERALLAVMRMNAYDLTALPVVDDLSKRLLSELSIAHLQAMHAGSFFVLLGTVGYFVEKSDPALAVPAMGDKNTTVGEMLRVMSETGRYHIWICHADHRVRGVVSLVDILRHLTQITDSQK